MNKEQIYDEKISPLMVKIIQICKDEGVAAFINFDISKDGDGLNVTTCLPDETGDVPEKHVACNRAVRGGGSSTMVTVEHSDGSKDCYAFI